MEGRSPSSSHDSSSRYLVVPERGALPGWGVPFCAPVSLSCELKLTRQVMRHEPRDLKIKLETGGVPCWTPPPPRVWPAPEKWVLATEGPLWGHSRVVLGAIGSFLEPFCGYLSP